MIASNWGLGSDSKMQVGKYVPWLLGAGVWGLMKYKLTNMFLATGSTANLAHWQFSSAINFCAMGSGVIYLFFQIHSFCGLNFSWFGHRPLAHICTQFCWPGHIWSHLINILVKFVFPGLRYQAEGKNSGRVVKQCSDFKALCCRPKAKLRLGHAKNNGT